MLPLLPSYVSENAVGAEYWGYNQDLDKGGHAFHFDMDSPHRAQTSEWRFPILTCIVFLSDPVSVFNGRFLIFYSGILIFD